MTTVEYLQNFLNSTIKSLEQVRKNGIRKELNFNINCSELEDYSNIDIRQSEKYKGIFGELANATGPILYWFEIVSETESKAVIDSLSRYKKDVKIRTTPALKTKVNYDSKILYVGKVKNGFWGRLIQHLGYYKGKETQGLQLYHWAKGLGLTLKVNVLEFDENMADLMPIIEYAFAKHFQPLVGKHR